MVKKHRVILDSAQRSRLEQIPSSSPGKSRRSIRVRALLYADEGPAGPGWCDRAIGEVLRVSADTVRFVRMRFAEGGLERALEHKRHPDTRHRRKLDRVAQIHLARLVRQSPPNGHGRWTLRLLADTVTELGQVDTVSHETIRQTLRRMDIDLSLDSAGLDAGGLPDVRAMDMATRSERKG